MTSFLMLSTLVLATSGCSGISAEGTPEFALHYSSGGDAPVGYIVSFYYDGGAIELKVTGEKVRRKRLRKRDVRRVSELLVRLPPLRTDLSRVHHHAQLIEIRSASGRIMIDPHQESAVELLALVNEVDRLAALSFGKTYDIRIRQAFNS